VSSSQREAIQVYKALSWLVSFEAKILKLFIFCIVTTCGPPLKTCTKHFSVSCCNHLSVKNQCTRPCKLPKSTDPSELERGMSPWYMIETLREILRLWFKDLHKKMAIETTIKLFKGYLLAQVRSIMGINLDG